jgi:hypothetical protein
MNGTRRRAGGAAGLAALLGLVTILALPSTAAAATVSDSYAISGYEYYATSAQGRFAGTATGSSGDLATWRAIVDHTPLTTTASITGGSATLATSNLVVIDGTFTGGSVTLSYQAHGCGIQRYAVVGSLGDVTRSDASTTGSGTFTATLTHYRTRVLGRCIVYSASVAGTIGLDFQP